MKLPKSILFFLFIIFTLNSSAKKVPVYPVSDIPEVLKKSADAVVRYDKEIVHIQSSSNIKTEKEYAVTILNENGNDYGSINIHYDKHSSVSELNIAIYDSSGNLIEKVKSKEIKDFSASGSNLYSDSRIKHYTTVQKNYPYTIVYSYSKNRNSYIHPGGWSPYHGYRYAIQESNYQVFVTKEIDFSYKSYQLDLKPEITDHEDEKSYSWTVKHLPALVKEPYSAPFAMNFPLIRCTSNDFCMDDSNGSMRSWEDLGKWIASLNQGRDQLDPETHTKIRNLVKDCHTDFEKVKTIYEYLQNKTRYVSIQVGIGGFQPFEAQFVQDKSYGDCKALSNYMKALLNIVHIPSYYTIVNAGSNAPETDTTFVHDFANHIILMVPLQKDTVWLECTSKYKACGFLGNFTDDREVLCITEKGGKLFHTPIYTKDDNTQHRSAQVELFPDGNAKAKVSTQYRGIQHDNIAGLFHVGVEDQKKSLYSRIDLPDFKINEINLSQEKTRIPLAELQLELDIRNYASKSGDRLFIPLNLLNRSTSIPKKIKDRKNDIFSKREYFDSDSIIFTIPEGYEIESLPSDKSYHSDFGKYESKVIQKDKLITYIREVVYSKFRLPADRYDELRAFIKNKVRADKAKLVLKKIESKQD